MEKTSTLSNGLIWFGAAVSIAEILTGTLIAPLGFKMGLLAIVIGHLIGCMLLFFAGLIGAKSEKSAMDTVKMSFGKKGSLLFSSLNVLQLIGWTAIMIVNGAVAANAIKQVGNGSFWSIVIGALIIIWLFIGLTNLGKVNAVAVGGLFVLTLILSFVVFSSGNITSIAITQGELSFGAAVELSVAMPLSWLPLISDYTKDAKEKFNATFVSSLVYFVGSCWMYIIGMGACILTGQSDIASIMLSAGLGFVALIIIVLSTVTTTFLDAYSAGISALSISEKIDEKLFSIGVCIIGVLLAVFTPILQIESFLYLIGSVFAPMIAIQIADFFILKKDYFEYDYNKVNLAIWVIGFILYRLFMRIDTPLGNTFPVMLIVGVICVIVGKVVNRKRGS